jgi:hypothetical protein
VPEVIDHAARVAQTKRRDYIWLTTDGDPVNAGKGLA